MSEVQEPLLDIEVRLANDVDGSFANGLIQSLQTELDGLKRSADAGLPPDDFALANQLMGAVAAAAQVVELTCSKI